MNEEHETHIRELKRRVDYHLSKKTVLDEYVFFDRRGKRQSRLLTKQTNLFNIAKTGNAVLQIGFQAGFTSLLTLLGNKECRITCFSDEAYPYSRDCFAYLKNEFGDRIHVNWVDDIEDTLMRFLSTYPNNKADLIHINFVGTSTSFQRIVNICRLLAIPNHTYIVVDRVWVEGRRKQLDTTPLLCESPALPVDASMEHRIYTVSRASICVLALALGDEFKKQTIYSTYTKIQYCCIQGYDLVMDETVYDTSRPFAWSKIKLVLRYLPMYTHVIWIDSDTFIMNSNIRVETFIEQMGSKDIMVGKDYAMLNTGVFIVKNTEFARLFFETIYEQTQFIDHGNWEQTAFIHLHDTNALNCKDHIMETWHTTFNSYWYNYKWGHFLIHFPGCRSFDQLQLAFFKYCPLKMETDSETSFSRRMYWLEHECENYERTKIESGFTVM